MNTSDKELYYFMQILHNLFDNGGNKKELFVLLPILIEDMIDKGHYPSDDVLILGNHSDWFDYNTITELCISNYTINNWRITKLNSDKVIKLNLDIPGKFHNLSIYVSVDKLIEILLVYNKPAMEIYQVFEVLLHSLETPSRSLKEDDATFKYVRWGMLLDIIQ